MEREKRSYGQIILYYGKERIGKRYDLSETFKKPGIFPGTSGDLHHASDPGRELDGREYHFVTEEDFQKLKAAGKIIEDRGYETVYGLWRYFTADNMDLEEKNYLGIGTLESYEKLKAYYGEEKIRPIYIEVEDGERLKRAIAREETQEVPKYEEMCRRFLADAQDFSEEKIRQAGIDCRFSNMDGAGGYSEIEKYLRSVL